MRNLNLVKCHAQTDGDRTDFKEVYFDATKVVCLIDAVKATDICLSNGSVLRVLGEPKYIKAKLESGADDLSGN